jgi:membrane protein DedA with SNARE-associated domain
MAGQAAGILHHQPEGRPERMPGAPAVIGPRGRGDRKRICLIPRDFEADMETAILWINHYGYFAIFFLLVLGIVGLPVPDEWLLTLTGYLVFRHELHLWPALAAASMGSMCGITVSYGLGRSAGLFFVHRYGRLLRLTRKDLDRVHAWFDRFGKWMLMIGFFLPGIRHLTAVLAGTSKMKYRQFSLFAYSGALLWSATFIALGFTFGEQWNHVLHVVERHLFFSGLVLVAVALVVFFRWRRKRGVAENG